MTGDVHDPSAERAARTGAQRSADVFCALPLLVEPATYTPCDWDLIADDAGRTHWLDLFRDHFEAIRTAARISGYPDSGIETAWAEIDAWLKRLCADPRAAGGELNILTLDGIRDGALRAAGVDDPFRAIKAAANEHALAQLADRLAALDALDESRLPEALARGMFAGNLFDMGAPETAARFHSDHRIRFDDLLNEVKARPWLHDGIDGVELARARKAVIFVDNAGGDLALGVLPLARALLQRGAEVILAASETPVLNDVTAPELTDLLDRAAKLDGAFADPRLRVLSTGTDTPLIDLRSLHPTLCDAAANADLIVLVGMGRALESNWLARFSCETWRVATIKEHGIARRRGGELFDCVFRVEGAEED